MPSGKRQQCANMSKQKDVLISLGDKRAWPYASMRTRNAANRAKTVTKHQASGVLCFDTPLKSTADLEKKIICIIYLVTLLLVSTHNLLAPYAKL